MDNIIKMRDGDLRRGLIECANKIKSILGDNLNIIEIGSYAGESSEIFANIFPKSKINCIDKWESYDWKPDGSTPDIIHLDAAEKIFDNICLKYTNIIKNKISSIEYAPFVLDNSIDFIYIDGDHKYNGVKTDLLNYIPKIKKRGIIAGHDYCWEGVNRAITEILHNVHFTFCDASWIYIKE
jgi:predicted O-methyltransferase YrrM